MTRPVFTPVRKVNSRPLFHLRSHPRTPAWTGQAARATCSNEPRIFCDPIHHLSAFHDRPADRLLIELISTHEVQPFEPLAA